MKTAMLAVAMAALWSAAATAGDAEDILETSGVRGGLIVHLGCGEGATTPGLKATASFLVHGLGFDEGGIQAARKRLLAGAGYGGVSFMHLTEDRLPYVDNLVNLLVVDDPGMITGEEMMRVLAPLGVLMTGQDGEWRKTVKPRPKEMDEWTHYLHGPGNNAVSGDLLVGPPRNLQWTAAPLWSRSHEYTPSVAALVSAGGKLFYLIDEGIRGVYDERLPERWFLHARDAFNGVLLWKVPVPGWGPKEWKGPRHWSAPMSLPRRLVASGGRVYVTLGYRAPVSVLDADTGRRLAVFAGTGNADELLLAGGRLIVRRRETLPYYPRGATAWNVHVRRPGRKGAGPTTRLPAAEEEAQAIVALDAETGRVLWETKRGRMMTLSLAASDRHVCYHDFSDVVCLDIGDGRELWRGESKSWPDLTGTAGTLLLHDGTVFYTADRAMHARDANTGRPLWSGPRIARTSIRHPPDMFVAGGLLWGGPTPDMATGRIPREESPHAGKPLGGRLVQGLDLRTGAVRRELDIRRLITPGHHVRCYRAKATERFLMWPKRGVEFVDIVDGTNHERCNWFRGECSYGVVPANGLVYAPPHPCQCNLGVVLTGFNALAAKRPDPAVPEGPRLIRGPAYDDVKTTNAREGDWPVYRHDAARSGRTASPAAVPLRECWAADIGGRLTPAVVSGGAAYVASIDRHTLYSLNAADGRILWTFTAGGRIDSPPSVHGGRVMFGCRDGRAYCLRATDGALAWRFRAAPHERRVVAFGQLESPWPVPGSLLIVRDRVYFAAGRSSFLDGGVHLYALAPETGEVLRHHLFDGPWDDIDRQTGAPFHMNGVKADILSSDGTSIFLSFQEFDLDLNRRPLPSADAQGNRTVRRHLMPRNGFLDAAWFDRNSWVYGDRWLGRHYRPGVPGTGQIMSFDETTACSVQVFTGRFFMSPRFVPGSGYLLRADVAGGKGKPRFAVRVPIRARGMVMAGETLFLAGVPDVPGGEAFYPALTGPAEMWAISAKDGRKLGGLALDAAPVFDGLAVAGGRVFVPLVDGTLRCLTPKP